MKRIIPAVLSILIPAAMLFTAIAMLPHAESKSENISSEKVNSKTEEVTECTETIKNKNEEREQEMIGIWVPCMCLDMTGTNRSESAWKDKITKIMDDVKAFGTNTVFFHVRPFSDAIYPSEYYPFSHIISGKQGKEVDYDPLKIAIETAHEKGLSFHAWINPLRVSISALPDKLSNDNPINKLIDENGDSMTIVCDGQTFLDPSYSEVRRLICDGVRELVRNYDLDGVHIDDYFYPTEDLSVDSIEYKSYKASAGDAALTQQEWRQQNINSLICGMYEATHTKKGCKFGISPQCNIENDYKMSADVRTWCSENGYCDYICPQTYVSVNHPLFPFNNFAETWRKMTTAKGVRLYFGLALYKAGSNDDSGTWKDTDDNLKREVSYIRSIKSDGFALFSYEQLSSDAAKSELDNLRQVM